MGSTQQPTAAANPFFEEPWNTSYGAPPFDRIREEHYGPAFDAGMQRHSEAIEAIAKADSDPTFSNTIEALERSGAMLNRVAAVFFNLSASDSNEKLQKLRATYAPKLSQHSDSVYLNGALFERVRSLKVRSQELDLSKEQLKLLDEYYRSFVRAGAELESNSKERLKTINARLAKLYSEFSDRLLAENNAYALILDHESQLKGLPEEVVAAAASNAKKRGHEGKWAFTLMRASSTPFLQFSEMRDLRKQIYQAYISRGTHEGERDTRALLKEMVVLRAERARLLGFTSHAQYMIDNNMAKTTEAVYGLLNKLWEGSLSKAKDEREALTAMLRKEHGTDAKLQPWDWWYYAEKVRKANYDLSSDELKPYFQVDSVRQGAFDTASRLFGITFEEVSQQVPLYHPDVKAFDVKAHNGDHVGLLYVDYHVRDSKRGGAWMNNLRSQSRFKGVRPIVVNVGNFPAATEGKPALLSWDEVRTLFHEFGHALHGLMSDVTYETLSGTNVKRDYVEFPSQLLENWAWEPSVIKKYARHYKTAKPIPDALIERLKAASKFNQGFKMTELVAAALLDLEWHMMSLEKAREVKDVAAFEAALTQKIGLIPEIAPRYHSSYFQHIFSSDGYSAGYYVYLWAQVLEADAFHAFQEQGDVFHPGLADKLKRFIFAGGGSDEEMKLYTSFRGKKPTVGALLDKRGLR